MHVPAEDMRVAALFNASFDHERAGQIADSWGFEVLGTKKIGSRHYWNVRRTDAPPAADIIGGPRRDLVRANPKAQEEARKVLQETGVDVLDADECYRIEEQASKWQAAAVSGAWNTSWLAAIGLFLAYWGIFFSATLPVSIPLFVLAAASLYGATRSFIRRTRNKREFTNKHLANVEAIRRVVRVAEDELLAGWRPSRLTK
ncbi:hypothetical protein HCC61_14335 [Streptomyces sp. HNM0575]|uniref:hypothetical protein n=1 Tax=Streptomyces sp. HNM0575 TaxID=2716338 RepID=UPI00145CD31C|nr:hypothetical protein [Streptomyces sp. HNM0575]NLU73842.1 hypothetical protein [Streptomyces sp. HNM0575]